jgi:hypothetical protein
MNNYNMQHKFSFFQEKLGSHNILKIDINGRIEMSKTYIYNELSPQPKDHTICYKLYYSPLSSIIGGEYPHM